MAANGNRVHLRPVATNGHPPAADSQRLRTLQIKFEEGTASPQQALAWLDFLLTDAQARHDEVAIQSLVQLREQQVSTVREQAAAKLYSPDNPQEYLAWVRPAELRPFQAVHPEPMDPDEQRELADSINRHGLLQPLLIAADTKEVVVGHRRYTVMKEGDRVIPVIAKEFSESEKIGAFLASNLCVRSLSPRQSSERRKQYTAVIASSPAQEQAPASFTTPLILGNDHATTEALAETLAQLSERERRTLARELVLRDATLQQDLMDEAVRIAGESADKKHLAAEVKQLTAALQEAEQQQGVQEHTIERLEEHIAALRMSQVKLTDAIEDLTTAKKEAEDGKRTSERELAALRARVETIQPLEQLCNAAQARKVIAAVMELAEMASKKLLHAAFLYLNPKTAPHAPKEMLRLLEDVVAAVAKCRHTVEAPLVLDQPFVDYAHSGEESA